ncbi:MAG: hypothetical protein GTN62_14370 [Gemmatimonadales bacterium]|nr:hypothetical protein [Gemmatimonadales bacterium]NIN13255.1 hypothetical protein [Gemmatimonadales bacterium]NIN51274.1 hypothetical protein [Gemmatimonadales bacterium]NIP08738.1 hypothetical protein [Gemmatimonadales bacterium]NIR03144.1 hypothetical protein [Gemmatimonadales bacterium]
MRRTSRLGVPLLLTLGACSPPAHDVAVQLDWRPVDSVNARLPAGIRVYAGQNDGLPLRAWYVRIEERDPRITTRVVASDDTADNRETVSSFASEAGACLAANGGYFTMGRTPADHVGLLVSNGAIVAPATGMVVRDSVPYHTARAAIGFTADGEIDIAWVSSRHDSLYAWPRPPPHQPGRPASPTDAGAELWEVREAVGAGPALVVDGAIRVTTDAEVFFGSSIPLVHPRTAAGRTSDGALLIMVVDGRQPDSRGVSLEELATMMLEVGAVEALNLDGGGSSTLVVDGILMNRPTGGTTQREVMSALVTFCR